MDSTIFDSNTENIYLDGIASGIASPSATFMQWVKYVTEYEVDKSGHITKTTTTTYEVPDIPVWEAFPQFMIADEMDVGEVPLSESSCKEKIDNRKAFYDILKAALVSAKLTKWSEDDVTNEVLGAIIQGLAENNLEMRICNG